MVPHEVCDALVAENRYFRQVMSETGQRASDAFPGHLWKLVDLGNSKWGQNGIGLYYDTQLPGPVFTLQSTLYTHLLPAAREYAKTVKLPYEYPDDYAAFRELSAQNGKVWPASLLIHYWECTVNDLHQDVYPPKEDNKLNVYFPYQAVLLCSQHRVDYEGGAFTMADKNGETYRDQKSYLIDKGNLGIFVSDGHLTKKFHGMAQVTRGERNAVGIVVGNTADRRPKETGFELQPRPIIVPEF